MQLRAFVRGLDAKLKPCAAKLADRGFSREQQAELHDLAIGFTSALGQRGQERGALRTARVARDSLFDRLTWQTGYFRRLGRAALRTTKDRADFDRVDPRAGKRAAKVPPAVAPPPAKAKLASTGSAAS